MAIFLPGAVSEQATLAPSRSKTATNKIARKLLHEISFHAFTQSASPAGPLTCLFPLGILRIVISLKRLIVFHINPGPRPEFGARGNRLLSLRSIDEIAGDWRS